MANGDDLGFVPAKQAAAPPPSQVDDLGFVPAPRPRPGLATEATGIGPHPFLDIAGKDTTEAFLHPTEAYKKEHPILGGIGERLNNLRETFRPGAMAAGALLGGPGGLEGGSSQLLPKGQSVPAMSLPGGLPRVSSAPRVLGETPVTVFDEPRQLGPVPQAPPRVGPPRPVLGTSEAPVSPQFVPRPTPASPTGPAESPRGYFNLGRGKPSPSVEEVVNQATGIKPLQPNVPLREQMTTPPPTEPIDPIKAKYPDPNVRQMVRANGERIYEAAKGDPATVKAIHDLTRVDLRQALVNSGEDVGQEIVTNSKFAGPGSITREDAFNRLLAKGLRPNDIVRLAKAPVKQ